MSNQDNNNPFPTNNNNQASSDYGARVKIGGLWQHTTKTGKTFLSGEIGAFAQIQIWPNQKRPGKKDPDFTVYITEKKKKEEASAGYNPNDYPQYTQQNPSSSSQNAPINPMSLVNDIPF